MGKTKVVTYGNMTATLHIPDLTDEERARRMKQIEQAAAALIIGRERSEQRRDA